MPPLRLAQARAALNAQETPAKSGPGVIRAAVLVPLFEGSTGIEVLLTKRTELVEHHKGQISFPGGAADEADADAVATALREAEEEIGLDPKSVEVLGYLEEFETPSGFLITPVAGLLKSKPKLKLNRDEVEEAFWVPVDFFLDEANENREEREWRGKMHAVYSYQFGGHRVWGATAAMLRGFLKRASG